MEHFHKKILTVLNSMMPGDFAAALKRHKNIGIDWLDLKDGIFGKDLLSLSLKEVQKAKQEIDKQNLNVFCLSSTLFGEDVEKGEEYFRQQHLEKVSLLIERARIFEPYFVRLLSAKASARPFPSDLMDYLNQSHPWILPCYDQAVEKIDEAGFRVTIENEVGPNLFSSAADILQFFQSLSSADRLSLTWDVQNLWQAGTFPALSVFQALKPLVTYVHIKGGIADKGSRKLLYKSALADASWPVKEILNEVFQTKQVLAVCLNPSHGEKMPGVDYGATLEKDLEFIRTNFAQFFTGSLKGTPGDGSQGLKAVRAGKVL